MVKLLKLLEQSLLMEGRVEDVLRKYDGKISPEVVNQFVMAQNQIDPAINNKYLDWMVKTFIDGQSADAIIKAIDVWHKNVHKIDAELISDRYPDFIENKDLQRIIKNPTDINSYKDLAFLQTIGNDAQKKLSKAEEDKIIQGETRLVYQDNQYQIRVPLTHRSSCKYGRGTAWCTRLPDSDNYFKNYTKEGVLFYIIDKTMPSRADHPMFKVAVLMNKEKGDVQIFNARDTQIGTNLSHFFPPEMIQAMKDYRDKYIIDLNALTKLIHKLMGSSQVDIHGWVLNNAMGQNTLTNGRYSINVIVDLKNNIVALNLIFNSKSIISHNWSIPGALVKNLEDIAIEQKSNPAMIKSWIDELFNEISASWNEIMTHFQPNIDAMDIHWEINSQINKYTGNWRFESDVIPTENNRKSVFKSVRIIPVDGVDVPYTILLVLDYMKQQYVLKCEEDRGHNQKEQYEDQIYPFERALLKDKNQMVNAFLEWTNEIVAMVYTEQWQAYTEQDDPKDLQKLAGKYTSKKYGAFTVEIDNDGKIHVYSEKLGTHYLIQNIKAFTDTIVNNYGLKKSK